MDRYALRPILSLLLCAVLFSAACAREPSPPSRARPTPGGASVPAHRPEPASAPPAGESIAAAKLDRQALAGEIGVECQDGVERDCSGGDLYDVELETSCGTDGYFGGVVAEHGAELRDRLPPDDRTTTARLSKGQIVCIEAIARAGQEPAYFYAVVLPVDAIAQCRGNRLCELYGDRTVSGTMRTDGAACVSSAKSNFRECARGWIRREDVEDFSNGM